MTARRCFSGKIEGGAVNRRAGQQLLDMMDEFERKHEATLGAAAGGRQAALDAAAYVTADAARKADEARGSVIAQANVLRAFNAYAGRVDDLRQTPGVFGFGNQAPPSLGKGTQTPLGAAMRSLLARDPWEIASWQNVHYLSRNIRADAHRLFADAIEFLRPKNLGMTDQATRELDVLRVLYGRTDVDAQARPVADAWERVSASLADQFIAAGGKLAKREKWRLPNPDLDSAKVSALGREAFKSLMRPHLDRADMLDFNTGQPLTDARFEILFDEAFDAIVAEGAQGLPSAGVQGRRMLANSRDVSRFFSYKSAESWQAVADAVGAHASVFQTMVAHIHAMGDEVAAMRVLGPNPEATRRFILGLFDREAARLAQTDPGKAGKATKANRAIAARVALERRMFEDLYAEVTGANRVPVSTEMARVLGDTRHVLSAAQLGSAMISSLTDPGTLMMAARFNGLPVMSTIGRAVSMMTEKGSEVFAAQQGLVLDTLAHAAGQADKVMGETIRTGIAAKLSNANIRASGLRRWTSVLRGAFGLEMMAHAARERGKAFGDLGADFRASLDRYGIGAADWDLIRSTAPHEPRANAVFIRPSDIAAAGHRDAADKFARLMHTEMDYAVIENDPVTRAMLIGQSQPGTIGGEARRAVSMYRNFPATFITMHFARAFARGWDGKRLSHGALTFLTMTALGTVAMQSKEIIAGRDPLSLDPTTGNGLRAFGKAMLQGGGLGVFGDVLFLDQTKYGNSWAATIAGPQFAALESVMGDVAIRNVQRWAKGEETHFAGDALYTGARYLPGSSLWQSRLAFQRVVLDQLHLMADDRARDRFARIEKQARKEWGQGYWWQHGRSEPRRAPNLDAIGGSR